MNDLDELTVLEDELGDALRRCLDGVLSAEHSDHGPSMLASASPARPAVIVGVASSSPRNRRRRWLLPAAAVLVAVAAGASVWSGSRAPAVRPSESVDDEPVPVSTMSPSTPATPALASPSSLAPSTTIMPSDPNGLVWAPSVEPAGHRITSVSVTTGGRVFDRPAARLLRRGEDGATVDAWIELSVTVQREGDTIVASPGVLVRGLPAMLTEVHPGMWALDWLEDGLRARVRTAGVARETVLQIAETAIVDPDAPELRPEGVLSGFEAPAGVVGPPDGAPTTSYSWLPSDGRAGTFVDASARPNTGLHTLDSLQAMTSQQLGWEHRRIELDRPGRGKVPAWVATSFASEFGRLIYITWIEDSFVLSVSGRAGVEQLQDVAEGFLPSDLAVARELRQRVDIEALELPVLDDATTPAGVRVTIHTTGTGANVVCVRAPFIRCQHTTSESSLVGDEQVAVVQAFVVDGRTWAIGWAEGEHAPHVVLGDRLEAIEDTARGTTGTFFAIPDPDEQAQFVFDPEDLNTGPILGGAIFPYWVDPPIQLVS